MVLEIISLVLLAIISVVYNSYIIVKYNKIPFSLSETSYILGSKKYYFFSLYTFMITFLLIPILFNHTIDAFTFLPFLFCGGLLYAGLSPLYKEGLDRKIHYTAAMVSFVGFIFYLIFCMGWEWMIIYVSILGALCLWRYKNYVYFAEMVALLTIIIWLIYKISVAI
jgi:hypothetical protein